MAHITHFVIFLEDNIIGVEYNNTGCRPSSISNYINEKFKAEYMLNLNETIISTTETKLNKTKLVKEIDLTLDKSSIDKFQSEQGELFEALQATQNLAKNICDDDKFTLSVRLKSRTGFKITDDIKNIDRGKLMKKRINLLDFINKFDYIICLILLSLFIYFFRGQLLIIYDSNSSIIDIVCL